MVRAALALMLTLLLPALLPAQGSSPKTVTAAEADSHIVKRTEPTIPPLAKLAKVGGKVRLHIAISSSGDVSSVKAISGHPLLIQSAIEAAKKWKYRPFVEGGKPVPVETDVELDFPGGMTEPDRAAENRSYQAETECRGLLSQRKYVDAERKCREAVEISNELPKSLILERSHARALLANAIFGQRRFLEAIPLYEEALALDKGYRKPDDADLATDYANLGGAYAVTGELAKADGLYATAVSTFEAAIQSLPQMKLNYTQRLKRALDEYAQVKEAEGQDEAAGQLRKKAAGL
jgi:TonB family protein